ncbi:MAG: hypothetical protein IJO56_00260 [Oscillospiraceae bacterium]|nr:hypothetical protein [Oscillospiraceae bacterium]
MENLEQQLGSVLSNPEMMQKLMGLAQSLGNSQMQEQPAPSALPELDLSMVQKMAGFARQSGIDPQQQALLKALSPYLCRERLQKLEKAMRAAKMAKIASAALGQRG